MRNLIRIQIGRCLTAFLVPLLAFQIQCLHAPAQEPVLGALTFGAVLNQLSSKVGSLINDAANAGEVIEMGAGGQIATAIANAKQAYADSLNLTMDRLTAKQKNLVDDITTEIGYLEHHVISELAKIVERGSMALNVIPFSKTFPQMGRYSPIYLAALADESRVAVHGNFFDAARKGYSPSLEIGDNKYVAAQNTTLELGFNLPGALYEAKPNSITRIGTTVIVPYREPYLLGLFHRRRQANFAFELIGLPEKAGRFVFKTTRKEMRKVTQSNQSGEFRQESTDDDIPDPIASGRVSIASPTAGWYVEPASVQLKVNWAEGDWKNFGNRSTTANAAWSIATVHHGIGTSGKIHFQLTWTEYRDQLTDVPNESTEELRWGSSKTFTVPTGGSWTGRYEQFNGRQYDVASAAFENPYLKVQTSGDSVTVVTVP